MTSSVPDGRRSRAGTGVLPPNPRQWDCENHGLDLRRQLGVSVESRLVIAEVFALLPNTRVVAHGDLAVADVLANHFRGAAGKRWSGLAVSLGDGSELIIYNDSHPETRTRATLMEEFFHLRLGHPRSRIQLLADGSRTRSLDLEVERIAFGSAAAALVPFCHLRQLVDAGTPQQAIARKFGVSPMLVGFRMNVTRLRRRKGT